MLYIMSTSILTDYGMYTYEKISVNKAQELIDINSWQSAVGHQSTADLLSDLLQREIPYNRLTVSMKSGDMALVFKLKSRPPEGAILNRATLEKIGYDLGLIKRIK